MRALRKRRILDGADCPIRRNGDTLRYRAGVRGSVRASTHASYERQVGRYIIPAIGRVKLAKLTPGHVQHLYREMQDRGLSARTVQYTHAVLHRALKQAKRWGMVHRNVTEDVDRPQLKRVEINP